MALVLTAGFGRPAEAVVVQYDTCWSSCENVGVGNLNTSVATLEMVQNGANVDFTLTNTVGNLGSAATAGTIISLFEFYYGGSGGLDASQLGTVSGGAVAVSFTFNASIVDASLAFNIDLKLPPPPGSGADLFTDGEILQWTIYNVDLADFLTPPAGANTLGIIHIQRLSNDGSVKYIDQPPTDIPEPGILLLLGFGLVGLGVLRHIRRRAGRVSERGHTG